MGETAATSTTPLTRTQLLLPAMEIKRARQRAAVAAMIMIMMIVNPPRENRFCRLLLRVYHPGHPPLPATVVVACFLLTFRPGCGVDGLPTTPENSMGRRLVWWPNRKPGHCSCEGLDSGRRQEMCYYGTGSKRSTVVLSTYGDSGVENRSLSLVTWKHYKKNSTNQPRTSRTGTACFLWTAVFRVQYHISLIQLGKNSLVLFTKLIVSR